MKATFKYKAMRAALLILSVLSILAQTGCKKLIEVDLPIDKSTGVLVYNNSAAAVAAMTGVYATMRNSGLISEGVTMQTAQLSDELQPQGRDNEFYLNDVPVWEGFLWENSYRKFLYQVNALIEGVSQGKIPQRSKEILLGEAKLVRAYIYFYLVNCYGDIPLVLTTDFKVNANIPRTPKEDVYTQIIKDLIEAQAYLADDFLSTDLSTVTIERVRPNKAAATALLARAYLYNREWQKAEMEATKLIGDARYQLLTDLNAVFLKNSSEAIWQMQPELVEDGNSNTPDGRYIIPIPGDMPGFAISPFLQGAFESDDLRRLNWITTVSYGGADYLIPYKYKIGRTTGGTQDQTEYIMVFRLAEQYLIRAEARARQGNVLGVGGAEGDLNTIRNRAGLPNTVAATQESMLEAIWQERRVELFTEGAHRWFDLKRTDKINAVMATVAPLKGSTWEQYKALLPIPTWEFDANPALRGHQNPGYPEK